MECHVRTHRLYVLIEEGNSPRARGDGWRGRGGTGVLFLSSCRNPHLNPRELLHSHGTSFYAAHGCGSLLG